jgi:hypothetical protein
MVGAAVGEAVDQHRIPVVGKDDRPVAREQQVEIRVRHAVRMFAAAAAVS